MSLIQTPWTQQPQQPVPIAGGDLMRGAYVWTPHNPRQLVGQRIVQASSETAYNSSPIGDKGVARKWSRSANAGVDFGTTQIITQNSGVTVLVVAAPTSAATMKVPFSQRVASGAFTQTDFVFNSNSIDSLGASAGTVVLTTYSGASGGLLANGQIDGKTHYWVAGNGPANGYIFRDGLKQTLATSTRTSTFTSGTQKLRIGNMADDASTSYPCDDPVYLVVVWDRLLSEIDARAVSENPWQVFKPLQRRIFAAAPAGGVGVTGSFSATQSPSTLSAYGDVAIGAFASLSQVAQVLNGVSSVAIDAAGSLSETSETLSSFGSVASGVVGAASISQLSQTVSASGSVSLSAIASISPSDQSVSASAAVSGGTVSGTANINPSAQQLTAAGLIAITGTSNIVHVAQSLNASGGAFVPLTDSQKIDLILNILSNRQTLDSVTGLYTLYADDGVTVLKTALAWEDAAGTIPYRGQGLRRLDAMQ